MSEIRWHEDRKIEEVGFERFLYIAQKQDNGTWKFYERSVWDTCWYEMPSNSELIRKVEEIDKK